MLRGTMATTQRRVREQDLVRATRALFDERGLQDAPIEDIAKAVGIARGLIYRQFSSKEELFVLTVTDYLAELDAVLVAAGAGAPEPSLALERHVEAYARFCERYPAFLDCALSLMQRPARVLHDTVSESVWLRLGQGMGACIQHLVRILRAGEANGAFAVADPELAANLLWTQVLGAMHLARIRVGLHEEAPGRPELFRVSGDDVVRACVDSALATAGARPGG
jgi:AcrR family transcriptional regulator